MRDMDKNPYSPDEQRVAQFFFDHGTGGGDDPIGFIIASHQVLAEQRNEALRWLGDQQINWPMEIDRRNRELATMAAEAAELLKLFDLRWAADQRAIGRWQAAHPGRDLAWPDHADLVVWLMEQLDAVNRAVSGFPR